MLKRPILYWQYRTSPKYKKLWENILNLFQKYYPNPLWVDFNLDNAKYFILDILAQRYGISRQYTDIPGGFDSSIYDSSIYDWVQSTDEITPDTEFDLMIKLRLAINQRGRRASITYYYEVLDKFFPGVDFYIEIHATKWVIIHVQSAMEPYKLRALESLSLNHPMATNLQVVNDFNP